MKYSYRDFRLSVNDVHDFLELHDMIWNHEMELILGSKDISYKDLNDNSFGVKISNKGSLALINRCAIINPISFIILDWKTFNDKSITLQNLTMNDEYKKYIADDITYSCIKYLLKKYKHRYSNLIENSMKVEIYNVRKEYKMFENKFDDAYKKYQLLINKYENIIDVINVNKR